MLIEKFPIDLDLFDLMNIQYGTGRILLVFEFEFKIIITPC